MYKVSTFVNCVGDLLGSFTGIQGTEGTSGTDGVDPKSLELKEVAL